MTRILRVQAVELSLGDIIRSGDDGYVVKSIGTSELNLEIRLWGMRDLLTVSPDTKVWVERADPFIIDLDLVPPEIVVMEREKRRYHRDKK